MDNRGGWHITEDQPAHVDINPWGTNGEFFMKNLLLTTTWLYPLCEKAADDTGKESMF